MGSRPCRWETQGTLRSGQSLITFGYAAEPDGPRWTTIYSAAHDPRVEIGPRVYGRDTPALRDLVETGGAIEHGMSGGPTVDERGRLIGMAFASYTVPGEDPAGFHVGVDVLRDTLAKFKTGVAPGWVGTGLFFRRASARPRGIVVTGLPGVRRGGYAHGGVLVTEVNGEPVANTFASWCRAVQTLPPARATLTIRRRPSGDPERVVITINRSHQP